MGASSRGSRPSRKVAPRVFTILDAMEDPALFGRIFRPEESWRPWKVFLKALFGLPMTEEEAIIFQKQTGRQTPPMKPAQEAWVVAGRKGGKSRIAALVAVYVACFRDHRKFLAPGERGTVMVIAADRKQARNVFRYINGLLQSLPMLAAMVDSRTKESINLTNGITIEVHTANFRTVRGYTVVAAICDEIAFWRSEESANPDFEILNGLRPGMATVPGSLLLCISSPYARQGALWQAYQRHYGQDGAPVLVWQADTLTMHSTLPDKRVIEEAYQNDPIAAASEWGAEFRQDIDAFVSRETVEAVVVRDLRKIPPIPSQRYVAFVDPSGGSGGDSMTGAVVHWEGEHFVLDLLLERRPPFSPEATAKEFCEEFKRYGITKVIGDHFGGEWPAERFRQHGIDYQIADKSKSDLYREMLPLITSQQVQLLDNSRLITQLCALERRTGRGGRDSIDHPRGMHDDLINAVAGALVAAQTLAKKPFVFRAVMVVRSGIPETLKQFPGLAQRLKRRGRRPPEHWPDPRYGPYGDPWD